MAYERYKNKMTKKEFYSDWSPEQLEDMDEELIDHVYDKYALKCDVFQRDNFECQNEDCETPDSKITLHHIRFQKNGGKDSEKNCITICDACHKAFHKGKRTLTFRGMTYQIHVEENIDWKRIKAENRKLRKSLSDHYGRKIDLTMEMIRLMIRWLEMEYDWDDDY